MRKLLIFCLAFIFAGTALAQPVDEAEREMMLAQIREIERMLQVMKKRYADRFGEPEKKSAPEPDEKEVDLKSGEVLFVLNDGSRLKGTVAISEFKLETVYGPLTIPLKEAKRISFADSKQEVVTVEFTATGTIEMEKFELETGRGKLTIQKKRYQANSVCTTE